jgi:hypothetical protein
LEVLVVIRIASRGGPLIKFKERFPRKAGGGAESAKVMERECGEGGSGRAQE